MNFDEVIDRVGTHSAKWDAMSSLYNVDPTDGISMWVADMDFRPPVAVTEALQARLDHGVYGYFCDDSEYNLALQNWVKTRHGFELPTEGMFHVHGLVQGVALCLNAFSSLGDGVITFTPVYHAFGRMIRANGRDPIEAPLVNNNGHYEMDLGALEERMKGHERIIVLCSPHNPGGRVWEKAELQALADFAKRHDLIIVSDEIHMDLVFEGHKHHVFTKAVPEAVDRTVYLMAATKSFNVAGTMTGTIIAPDSKLRAKVSAQYAAMGISANLFGMLACTAAFEHGAKWMDEAVKYIEENARILGEGLEKIPGVKSMRMQATYLSWVDFRGLGLSNAELHKRVHADAKIAANHGNTFGEAGEGFLRFNVATPRVNVERAVERMQAAFDDIQ